MTTAVLVHDIDQHRDKFGVEPICTVLHQAGMPIAPSSCYAAKTKPPSARAVADEQHLTVIRRVHGENYGVYGSARCTPNSTGAVTGSPGAPCTG